MERIATKEVIQKNCENILTSINKERIILKENDIYFYYVLPYSGKSDDLEYNKKMKDFISDLGKYKYKYLEFNNEKMKDFISDLGKYKYKYLEFNNEKNCF